MLSLFFFHATCKHARQHPLVSFLTPFPTSIVNVFQHLVILPIACTILIVPYHHSYHFVVVPSIPTILTISSLFVFLCCYYCHSSLSFTIPHHYFYCIIVLSPFVEPRKNVSQTQNPNHELEFYQGHPTFGCLGCWHVILESSGKDKMCATLV